MGKVERMEKAANMRMNNVTMMRTALAIVLPENFADMTTAEQALFMTEYHEPVVALIPVISENQGVRTQDEAKEALEESGFIGTVCAYRRLAWGKSRDGVMRRVQQTTFKIE